MCLLAMDDPNRIDVTDIIIVHLQYGEIIEGTVVKKPGWFSKEWGVIDRNTRDLNYFRDYIRIELVMKKRVDKNYE